MSNPEYIEDFNDHACRVREHMAGGVSVDVPGAAAIAKINLDIMEQMHDELECKYEQLIGENPQVTPINAELTTASNHYTIQDVAELLASANPNDRKEWLVVGTALHKHTDSNFAAFNQWVAWSMTAHQFIGYTECALQWASFSDSDNETGEELEVPPNG